MGSPAKGDALDLRKRGESRLYDSHCIVTHTTSLSQEPYINNLVECFGPHHATTVTTPLEPSALFTKDQRPAIPAEFQDMDMFGNNYRELIASL